jgi:hypothetical protein
MSNFKGDKFQLVELNVVANATAGSRIYFQDQPQLRSQSGQLIYIDSITPLSSAVLPVAPSSQNPVVGRADFINAVLTLNVDGKEDRLYIPLSELNPIDADTALPSVPYVRERLVWNNLYKVDWTKSYIQLSQVATLAPPFSYVFGVWYHVTGGNGLQGK